MQTTIASLSLENNRLTQKYNFPAKFFIIMLSMPVNRNKLCKFKSVLRKRQLLVKQLITRHDCRLVRLIRFADCHIIKRLKQLAFVISKLKSFVLKFINSRNYGIFSCLSNVARMVYACRVNRNEFAISRLYRSPTACAMFNSWRPSQPEYFSCEHFVLKKMDAVLLIDAVSKIILGLTVGSKSVC